MFVTLAGAKYGRNLNSSNPLQYGTFGTHVKENYSRLNKCYFITTNSLPC